MSDAFGMCLLANVYSYSSNTNAAPRMGHFVHCHRLQQRHAVLSSSEHHQQQWLPSRQRHLLEIVNPNTGNEVLIDSPHRRICDQPSAATSASVISSVTNRVSDVVLLMSETISSPLYIETSLK